ncbi:TPA: hypothetical protein J7723_001635 [Escherichia coli]|nr:hypothetical protein [Escherichia coli]
MAGVLAVLGCFIVVFLIVLIPSWLLLLAYNYMIDIIDLDWHHVPVTFWSVVCVTFILAVLRGIFQSNK